MEKVASDPAASLALMIAGARPLDLWLAQDLSGHLAGEIADKCLALSLHGELVDQLFLLRRANALQERSENFRRDASKLLQRIQATILTDRSST